MDTVNKKEETKGPKGKDLFNLEEWKKKKHPPEPSRFEEYILIEGGAGFTVKGGTHVFYFDEYGGWFDEWGNYYNKDNVPTRPPDYKDENSDDYEDYGSSDEDLAGEYDNNDEGDEGVDDEYKKICSDEVNAARLKNVLAEDTPIYIRVRNINYRARQEDFLRFLRDRKIDIVLYEFGKRNQVEHDGYCKLKVENKTIAKAVAALNGESFYERKLQIEIEVPSEDEEADISVKKEPVIVEQPKPVESKKLDAFLAD